MRSPLSARRLGGIAFVLALARAGLAQGPPPGYYDGVDDSSAVALRTTLHDVIDDHIKIPYTSGGTDTWTVLEIAQYDPNVPGNILTIYRNDSHPKQGTGNPFYEREHSWPKSYGFPDDGADNYPYSDCHQLFLSVSSYNQARSNKPFRFCNPGCAEYVTVFNDGQGGAGGPYPGDSNWTTGAFSSGTWEVWSGRRGDLARAMFYMDIRYEGGTNGDTGQPEPDLRLTNSTTLIDNSSTGNNESIAYMGIFDVLMQWHLEDPVDAYERRRNDFVWAFQGNRNPFVDFPSWVDCLYDDACDFGSVYCEPAVPNSTGNPAEIFADGSLVVADNDFTLVAGQLPANQFGYFLTSMTQSFVANPGGSQGNLCLGGQIGRFRAQIQNSGPFGTFGIPIDLTALPLSPPHVVQPGETWNFQAWYRDVNPTSTSNFTPGLEVLFQ